MELKDILSRGKMRLKKVSFINEYPIDIPDKTFTFMADDSLGDIKIAGTKIETIYQRNFYSEDLKIKVEVEFCFRAEIKPDVEISEQELLDIIKKNKKKFFLFAPAESSLIISNIMRSAGFPPMVTQPTFIEKEEE